MSLSKKPKKTLGLAKTIYNGNITELTIDENGHYTWETLLQERFTRKKWSGQWPMNLLELIGASQEDYVAMAENRDITTASFVEELYQKQSLFYELLKKKNLEKFSSHSNSTLQFIPHHIAHACSALAHMPYEKGLILVMDGGGNEEKETSAFFKNEADFFIVDNRSKRPNSENAIEHTSIFYWNGTELTLLDRESLSYEESSLFLPGGEKLKLADGIGSAYEKAAQLIFNDNLASGKVMGLAGFGRSFYKKKYLTDIRGLQKELPWSSAFAGSSKSHWQASGQLTDWQDVAATIQEAFEENLSLVFSKLTELSALHNLEDDLPVVFTGGCALNCTANYKMANKSHREIYIPPNPGDEGISLGLSFYLALKNKLIKWRPREFRHQQSSYGRLHEKNCILEAAKDHGHRVETLKDFDKVAELIEQGNIIAWYQGRSECGPRSLGHRSLLARPDLENLKKFLNSNIKFREEFRPYGASVLWEKASHFFDVSEDFQNPFMSFATPVRESARELLREVTHIDGTCRMQTVMREQNPACYDLLKGCEGRGMAPVLLNTSLNIMGEPIVETPQDAFQFLKQSVVKYLVIDNSLITKEKGEK